MDVKEGNLMFVSMGDVVVWCAQIGCSSNEFHVEVSVVIFLKIDWHHAQIRIITGRREFAQNVVT